MEQSYYERNREKIKAKAKERYWKKREEIRAKQAEYQARTGYNSKYYQENRERLLQEAAEKHRANPGRKYGLTAEVYWKMVEDSKGLCESCGESMEKICVDHDHQTGKVRGLICHPCNVSIGLMKDDPFRLEKAAQYLRNHAAR